jgi:hypothetical protein
MRGKAANERNSGDDNADKQLNHVPMIRASGAL